MVLLTEGDARYRAERDGLHQRIEKRVSDPDIIRNSASQQIHGDRQHAIPAVLPPLNIQSGRRTSDQQDFALQQRVRRGILIACGRLFVGPWKQYMKVPAEFAIVGDILVKLLTVRRQLHITLNDLRPRCVGVQAWERPAPSHQAQRQTQQTGDPPFAIRCMICLRRLHLSCN